MEPILVSADNANTLVYNILDTLMNKEDKIYKVIPRYKIEGRPPVHGDGLETREMVHAVTHLSNINNSFIFMPERKNDIFACIAECLWVLGGRDDMDFMSTYLPRAILFSDNGESWRAGYGTRLRHWQYLTNNDSYYGEVDQIKGIVDHLKSNINSRQAVMTIWNPVLDLTEKTIHKDYPCSNWIHYLVRDNKLECTVAIRSNDAVFGYSAINLQEFAFLQRIIAALIKVEEGSLTIVSDSLHIYETHYEQVNKILKNSVNIDYNIFSKTKIALPSVEWLDSVLSDWFSYESSIRNDISICYIDEVSKSVKLMANDDFYDYLIIPFIGLYSKVSIDDALELTETMSDHSILKAAVKYQLLRKLNKLDKEILNGDDWCK